MSRMICALAAVALSVAAAGTAAAAPLAATPDDDRSGVASLDGVLQQGKGQGGGQGNAQGGGQARGQGGGQEARESRGRSGGGDARPTQQGGQGRGQGQSARPSGQGSGQGSGRSSDARGSSGERGKGSSSGASTRSEGRGNSDDAASRSDDRGASAGASGRGNSDAARGANASAGRPAVERGRSRSRLGDSDLRARIDALPQAQRRLAGSRRASERAAVGAIARGHARGLPVNAFDVRSDDGRVRVLNRRGDLLLDMDDRDLGGWRMRRLGDWTPRANAPAFCRSGQGHPVWGREWCIDKGFGLGSRAGTLWSRGGIDDVIFRRPDYRTGLDRGGLIGVLGDIVFGRLALQAITLGYDQPLVGVWLAEPQGPAILRVNSGPYEVAEFYDADRDGRAEVLYVVQPVW